MTNGGLHEQKKTAGQILDNIKTLPILNFSLSCLKGFVMAFYPLTNIFEEIFPKMPIYEYKCAQCGKIDEIIQKFSDEPLTTCRNCEGTLHKLISQSSFHLKGSGWYVTDYASKSKDSSSSAADKKEKTAADTKETKKAADKTP